MKTTLILTAITLSSIFMSCGGKKGGDNHAEEHGTTTPTTAPAAVTYDAFSKEKLQGSWTVIDAAGYSKNELMGKVYVFAEDKATFYNKSMVEGTFEISGDKLKLIQQTNDSDGGVTTIGSNYTGGFSENGSKLQLNAADMQATLQKK
jgi:hypothetical protein